LTLLARVQQLLSEEYPRTGKERLFCRLQQMLTRDPQAGSLAEAARDLGMTEGAVKVALHRLRERFGGQLREEIAQTVATPEEVDEEIRDLFEALRK
jgi:RNA polymerase sigma-70 factor (ECF subfamily)